MFKLLTLLKNITNKLNINNVFILLIGLLLVWLLWGYYQTKQDNKDMDKQIKELDSINQELYRLVEHNTFKTIQAYKSRDIDLKVVTEYLVQKDKTKEYYDGIVLEMLNEIERLTNQLEEGNNDIVECGSNNKPIIIKPPKYDNIAKQQIDSIWLAYCGLNTQDVKCKHIRGVE